MDLTGQSAQLVLLQGQHRCLVGRQRRMQVKDGAHVSALQFFLFVGVAQEGQHHPVHAQGGLDAVRNIFLVGHRIQVFHALAAVLLVLRQVVIRPVRHAPQFAPAKGEQELKVCGRFGIEGQLLRLMVPQPQALFPDAQAQQPVFAEGTPVVEPLQILTGLAEEFQFHLLKLPHTEDEVAGGNLIPEALADLGDARRKLFPGGPHGVLEVHENTLGRFRTQVNLVRAVLVHAGKGLEHQVELPDARKVLLAAYRADDVMLGDELLQFCVAPAVAGLGAFGEVFNQLVRAEAGLAGFAVHQRIVEAAHVAAGHPDFSVHQNRAVQSRVILALLHKFLPPGLFDVVLEFHTQRTVVPGVRQSAVNLGPGKDKSPVFAKRHQFVHCQFCHSHLLSQIS